MRSPGTHRRRSNGLVHKDRLELSRAIMAFGSSKKGSRLASPNFAHQAIMASGGSSKASRPGQPSCGLHSWENPNILPGAIGNIAEISAAPALALLHAQPKIASAPPQTPHTGDRAQAWPVACVLAVRALAEIFPILDQYRSADRAAVTPGN